MPCVQQQYSGAEIKTVWNDIVGDRWLGTMPRKETHYDYKALTLDLAVLIAKQKAETIKQYSIADPNCVKWADLIRGAFLDWANQNGGGTFAAGYIGIQDMPNRPFAHKLNWVYTNTQELWLLDAPFHKGTREKWVYQITPEMDNFFDLRA